MSSRSGKDIAGESLISKAIIQVEKKIEVLSKGRHQNERPSLSVAFLVSTSSVSRQILEILSKLKCHEIHEGKLEKKTRVQNIERKQPCVKSNFILVTDKLMLI